MNEKFVIKRDNDVNELIDSLGTNEIKVIIGLRRAGKSYLLKELFYEKLKTDLNFKDSDIRICDLDSDRYRDIRDLDSFKKMLEDTDKETKVIIIDEVQKAGDGYEEILIDFNNANKNIDIYITGSNSKSLSNDILGKFKEHTKRHTLKPVSYRQIKETIPDFTLDDYFRYGSLPIVLKKKPEERLTFLNELYESTYLSDIYDRCKFQYLSNEEMKHIIDNIVSNLENPISTFKICKNVIPKGIKDDNVKAIYKKEISKFVEACVDSFLLIDFEDGQILNENTPDEYRDKNIKKYCFDVGLFNVISTAIINKKNSCILENIVFLELLSRNIYPSGKHIEVGESYKTIDFCYENNNKYTYIQAEFNLNDNCYDREIGNLEYAPENGERINIYYTNSCTKAIPRSIKNISLDHFINK